MESTKKKFEIGDEVVTVESPYLIGSISNPIKTGTKGVVLTLPFGTPDTLWVNFAGNKQCIYSFEIRKVTKLDKALS